MWPHLQKLIDILLSGKHLIVLKRRQVGLSSLLCAYGLWKAKFFLNVKVLILSQGEDEARDLISKVRYMDDHLPDYLKSRRDPDQTGFIGFPDTRSEVRALPSTEKAGHGTDASLVICDEWEYHPYAEQNFAALKPTIDAGGQFVGLSTVDKTKLNTFFKTKYIQAKSGKSEFIPFFIDRWSRPDQDEKWFERISKDYPDWQLEQEYPETEEEALSVLKTRKVFSEEALANMPIVNEIKCDLSDKYKGMVHVYKLPIIGRKYCVFTDPSDGKEDPHVIIVRDHVTGEWVAVSHGYVPADECARIHDDISRFYNFAWNNYEMNSRAGGIFSEKMKELSTPNQMPFLNTNKILDTKGKKGWWTAYSLKQWMERELEEKIRLRQEVIYDKDAIIELGQYLAVEGDEWQAPQGGHDDFIIAGGGVICIDKYMPVGATAVTSTPYRERW